MTKERGRLFSALLRHFRQRRGLSQLDLALAADVSARHVSFLETGRAQPSREMVLRLGATLGIPLRDQNALLVAAGMPEAFPEPSFDGGLPEPIRLAVERMAEKQEPYPLVVMNRVYDVLLANQAAQRLLIRFVADPGHAAQNRNALKLLFDARLMRNFVLDWERAARTFLGSLYREMLMHPEDERLSELFEEIRKYPDVPESFREPDLESTGGPTFTIRLRRGDLELGFFTTLTAFTAPESVTLEEIRIESYFPVDEATSRACARFAEEG